jgi:hypothetical protein
MLPPLRDILKLSMNAQLVIQLLQLCLTWIVPAVYPSILFAPSARAATKYHPLYGRSDFLK